MKKIFLVLLLICSNAFASGDVVLVKSLTPAVTTVATGTTNSTAGTKAELTRAPRPVRLYLTAAGVAGTTNGTLVVKLITSPDDVTYDTGSSSTLSVTLTAPNAPTSGLLTNTVSTLLDLGGVRYIKIGAIENTTKGSFSNITVNAAYPQN